MAREGAGDGSPEVMSSLVQEEDVFRASCLLALPEGKTQEPSWLQSLRRGARARFEERPLPTTRDEAWRFTSVKPILSSPFAAPLDSALGGAAECMLAGMRLKDHEGEEAVFVNGRYEPGLSRRRPSSPVKVLSLKDALASDAFALEGYLGRVSGTEQNAFADLNSAAATDGAVVFIPAGLCVKEAVHLLFLQTGTREVKTLSSPRTLVVAGRGSESRIVESYGGPPGEGYLTNAVTEVVIQEGALLEHVRVQREGQDAFHTATLAASLGRDARFHSHVVSLGAALSRLDLRAALGAPGAECQLNGLFVAKGAQHVDHHTVIDHAQPHGTSRELYKGILAGRSRGVFDGKVLVRAGAAKTDAQQTNKNLLLSREALVDSTPALEILTDDVKCKHGSTTGQLDEVALFYLRSRGLDEAEAQGLMTFAFAADLVSRLPVASLRAGLERYLQRELGGLS